jgi:UDPglucose 6-dehydrogenase
VEVLSNPEFLAEGTAISDLLYPDRVLIGSSSTPKGMAAAGILRSIYEAWVEPTKVLTVNVWSSELAKLVANAMLAQRISSINTISAICDQTGANIDEVSTAISLDSRIGSKFLKAGIGFGGSCFKKDILSLVYLSNSLHLPEVADYWKSVLTVNDFQRNRFMSNVVNKLHGALSGKKITVFGFTFKEDTNDMRESPAVDVVKELLQERPREIAIYDPGCLPTEIKGKISSLESPALKPNGPVETYPNYADACKGSSAILILTAWNQFAYPPRELGQKNIKTRDSENLMSHRRSTDGMNEAEISRLEEYLRRKTDSTGSTDPLKRLRPEPACAENCSTCLDANIPKRRNNSEQVDWELVASGMREPKWVFDGRNIVDCKAMLKLGLRVESLGKGIHL